MMNVLKYPPIKYTLKKIPDNLVYNSHKNKHYHDFMMSTTTKPFSTCYAYCNKGNYYNNEGYFPSLLVYMIKSNPQGNGLGSKMLDVMSNFSKKQGCEGRFHLFSTTQFSPNRIPHIFYRKYGMSTGYAQIDKKLDKFIKYGEKDNDLELLYSNYHDFSYLGYCYDYSGIDKVKLKEYLIH